MGRAKSGNPLNNKPPLFYGFTLIELVVTIAISTMITAALYLSLKSALDSWEIAQDQLLLQDASARIMEEVAEGLPDRFGLRDALEIADAAPQYISTVMPWTDDTHDVYSGIRTYNLNKHIKPGTGLPIAEALLPGAKEYKVVPIGLVDKGKSDDYPEAYTELNLPAGSRMHFTFHPDYRKDYEVVTALRYDAEEQAIFVEDNEGKHEVYKNPFGVKITDFLIRYFDNTNTEVGSNGSISLADIPSVTGLEIAFKAKSRNGNEREAVTFISLRNAPLHSGNLSLREGSRFPIPNSNDIKALLLINVTGIDKTGKDVIILLAKPQAGKAWKITVEFAKPVGSDTPIIDYYSVEYPPGNKVYSERPRTPADLGLDLMNLGINGRYDYDNDGMDDSVVLNGKVTLEVKKMEVQGAAVFVRP